MNSQMEKIIVVDFGGQYCQLIARRVRNLKVYSEIVGHKKALEKIKAEKPIGIIFTGGPNSVYEKDAPLPDAEIFNLGIPILGICYGMQAIVHSLGGTVARSQNKLQNQQSTFCKSSARVDNVDESRRLCRNNT